MRFESSFWLGSAWFNNALFGLVWFGLVASSFDVSLKPKLRTQRGARIPLGLRGGSALLFYGIYRRVHSVF